jgi:hypothetical protein
VQLFAHAKFLPVKVVNYKRAGILPELSGKCQHPALQKLENIRAMCCRQVVFFVILLFFLSELIFLYYNAW